MTPVLFALLLLLAPASEVLKPFPGVTDSSFVAANGDRTQRLSIEVPAPPARIWPLLSSAEGWMRWGVKTAYVDFREGGVIETSYREGVAKGERDNIKNQIVAIVPQRMLVFRNVQAPRDFKDPELFARVISTISLEPAGKGRTRITVSGDGYGKGDGFDRLYDQFLAGNAYTLVKLNEALR